MAHENMIHMKNVHFLIAELCKFLINLTPTTMNKIFKRETDVNTT